MPYSLHVFQISCRRERENHKRMGSDEGLVTV
jgi:hypothetical protein